MKKLTLFFALCAIVAFNANAQEYKKFKVNVGAGYAIPGGNGAKGGALFTVEPSYKIQDQIQIGLRIETAALVGGFSEDFGSEYDVTLKVSKSNSFTLNGQYYFNNNGFRPFVGAGFGVFMIKGADVTISDPNDPSNSITGSIDDQTKFGFYPRVGFDAGHFTLSLDYNLIGETTADETEVKMKNSYIGIRIGGFFGGGKN